VRAFAWFVGALLTAALIAAALAYPAFEATSHFASWKFHRVASRIAMLVAVAELVWVCRHLDIRSKRDFGFGLPWRKFLKVSLSWGVIGIGSASVGAAFLLATHLRIVKDPAALASAAGVLRLLLIGLSSGIAVALLEETVIRGAMHTAIARESGTAAAVLLTAPLYAITHFFGKASIPPDQVNWASGFAVLAGSAAPLGHPALVFDSFLAWLAVGLILSLTRVLTGNIAVAIGLHAGWVVVLRVLQESTAIGTGSSYAGWVGAFDGLLGYWLLPWSAAIGVGLWLTRRAWVPYAAGDGEVSGARDASRSSRSTGSSISR
jgi:uncharacterized protein